MRSFARALIFALAVSLGTAAPVFMPATASAGTAQLAMFDTEAVAQAHCPRDVVVWLNTKSGIYHEKGMRWYGKTKHVAYVCRKEADAAGDRDTRNGQ
jgi:hypothetical protein